jgi:hypothetical protein
MIETKQASTLADLLAAVKAIASGWTPNAFDPQEVWFRGQARASYSLVPGLYRPRTLALNYDERALFTRFKNLATPFVPHAPADEWEWYFLAQHYGLPTRLLDWSESLLAALYFALCSDVLAGNRLDVDRERNRGLAPSIYNDDSPVVWMIDAGTVNKVAVNRDETFTPGGTLTAPYLPDALGSMTGNELPMAILAPRANQRIAAQQGVFTVHGRSQEPLEAIAAKSAIQLARIVIDRANMRQLWHELSLAGVTKYAMFPSIDSAAEHVCWIMQAERPAGV